MLMYFQSCAYIRVICLLYNNITKLCVALDIPGLPLCVRPKYEVGSKMR